MSFGGYISGLNNKAKLNDARRKERNKKYRKKDKFISKNGVELKFKEVSKNKYTF